MFGWFFKKDPVEKLRKEYQQKVAKAERALNEKGDRALHAQLLAEAEELGRELDRLIAERET